MSKTHFLIFLTMLFPMPVPAIEPANEEIMREGLWVTHIDPKGGEQEAPMLADKRSNTIAQVNPKERDALLKKVGLASHVAGMDELERNILVLRAQKNSLDELKRKYPSLPAASLARLVEALK